MNDRTNLVLKLKTLDSPHWETHEVAWLRLDGHGRMILCDAETGETTRVEMARVEGLVIESVMPARQAA